MSVIVMQGDDDATLARPSDICPTPHSLGSRATCYPFTCVDSPQRFIIHAR
jgi:hypothetical protein